MASEKLAYAYSNLRSFWKVNCYHLYSFPQRSRPLRLRSIQRLRVHSWILWQYLRVWLERRKWRSLKRGLRRSTTDELYSVWVKVKLLSIQDDQPSVSHTTSRDTISDSSLAANQTSICNQPPETRNQQPSAPKASVLDSILVYQRVVNQQVKHPCLNIYLENNLFSICRKRRARKSRLS